MTDMGWQGHLRIDYTRDAQRTVAHDLHHGPLRVLQRLYPEGDAICHHVLVHPPGGLVGGDALALELDLAPDTHALLTTPGATRFYRSEGQTAEQRVTARVAAGARLEWWPLETLAYDGCLAENHQTFHLAPEAEMMGWDVLGLGLPAAQQPWQRGHYRQRLTLPGLWLERADLRADDALLLDSPVGWGGDRVLGTMWMAMSCNRSTTEVEPLIEASRALMAAQHGLPVRAGITHPDPRLVVVRALASRTEPILTLFQALRAHWRQQAWGLAPHRPRIWAM